MEEDDYYDSRMSYPPARDVGYQAWSIGLSSWKRILPFNGFASD
jgi:hypothetical protein